MMLHTIWLNMVRSGHSVVNGIFRKTYVVTPDRASLSETTINGFRTVR